MTNHPNRKRLYSVVIQPWSNSGLGWEPLPDHLSSAETHHDVTREQANALTLGRERPEGTSVDVYRGDGDTVAMAGRNETELTWLI